jgi:two-component system phosphate regulon sensor histidine kinase PhoR
MEATLEVEDNGAGIPLQAQTRVFERFFRVDEDRARLSGGTGLGLSIVKHVVEMHGGHVRLKSELGEGSTFTVRLPLVIDPS